MEYENPPRAATSAELLALCLSKVYLLIKKIAQVILLRFVLLNCKPILRCSSSAAISSLKTLGVLRRCDILHSRTARYISRVTTTKDTIHVAKLNKKTASSNSDRNACEIWQSLNSFHMSFPSYPDFVFYQWERKV